MTPLIFCEKSCFKMVYTSDGLFFVPQKLQKERNGGRQKLFRIIQIGL